jgi:hypothetical protein
MPLGADGVWAMASLVLDVMAQSMAFARVHPDGEDGQPVHAPRCETPVSGQQEREPVSNQAYGSGRPT